MQTQSKSWHLVLAILIASAMVCATLLALNLHRTYPMTPINATEYVRLLSSGCTVITTPDGGQVGFSCPLWVNH